MDSFVDEEPIAQVAINRYDQYSLRGAVDDCISELLEEWKFSANNYHIHVKILCAAIACAVTAFDQLYKPDKSWEFPNRNDKSLLCVAIYAISMGIY